MNTRISTRKLTLIPIVDEDIPILWKWRNTQEFVDMCTVRKSQISMTEFVSELKDDFNRDRFCQMMIMVKKGVESVPAGTIFCYGFNRYHGYIFVTIYMIQDFQMKGYGAEAFAVFIDWLFSSEHELHKVYADVYSINSRSISCLKNAGFTQEGCFVEHSLIGGYRCDLLRFAFFRRNIRSAEKLLSRIKLG